MRRWGLGMMLVAAGLGHAAAQEPQPAPSDVRPPRLIHLAVDWPAIAAHVKTSPFGDLRTHAADAAKPRTGASEPGPDAFTAAAIAWLNEVTEPLFPGIAASAVPVLLPVALGVKRRDAQQTGVLASDAAGLDVVPSPAGPSAANATVAAGFRATFFRAGPAGYDAVFEALPFAHPELAGFTGVAEIHITGGAFVYDLDEPAGADPKPLSRELAGFAGLERTYLQHHMRYLFQRYGIQYAVTVLCFDGRARGRRLSCRAADAVVTRLFADLRLAGGPVGAVVNDLQPTVIDRPKPAAATFSYRPAGDLLPGTGRRRQSGRDDPSIYADIRFPLAEGPAHVYSQVHMSLTDCGGAPGQPVTRRLGKPFVCPRPANADAGDEAALMPAWRDSFCEARDFSVGQCPGGRGHQGQDIIPFGCSFPTNAADRCTPDRTRLLAAADGAIIRRPAQEGLTLQINAATHHLRIRYLHMTPSELDALGMISGRTVHQGDMIGTLSNFSRRPGGTSYHLHLDMQVFSRAGWVFVNPYMTLVTAYERMTGSRGRLLPSNPVVQTQVSQSSSANVQRRQPAIMIPESAISRRAAPRRRAR